MIEIFDKQDEQRKLRRSYEDYIPVPTETGETAEPQSAETETAEPQSAETETAEPTEPTETAETKPQPTETEK